MSPRARVRAVVFDLDGTLVDSRRDILGAAEHALRAHGRPVLPPETILGFVGDGARSLVARTFSLPVDAPEVDAPLASFLEHYAVHGADHTTVLPGVREVLSALSALPLAVCTNKMRGPAELTLRHLGLRDAFRVVVAGGDLPEHKPDPSVLRHVASELGVAPDSLAMVGDGPQDVLAGKAVSAWTVGLVSVFAPEETLRETSPDALIRRMSELPDALARFAQATSE
ncbi:MAG TPA: HAD-IA family hydrolase [Polyangiaceae bacterium]|nr:HAD-IA family hydrolase [Polyangiaceae bacterium]